MKIFLVTADPSLAVSQKKELESIGDLVVIKGQKLSNSEVIKKASDVEILIPAPSGIERVSRNILNNLKHLKFIALRTVGSAWIDLEAAKNLGIPVSNIKGANSESVAEHTWGMILGLAKRINEFDRDVRNKGAYKFSDYQGKEVYGKTLGVIGLGDIGKKVVRIAKGFNMKVLGVRKTDKPVSGVKLVSLETLVKSSDVITVCVPLTPETKNLISAEEISRMKQGVILVNTAREGIVNKKAIVKAVKKRKVFGYGIETKIMQPLPPKDKYLSSPHIIVTPHNAFYTEDAEDKSYDLVIENIKAYLKGRPQNLVT